MALSPLRAAEELPSQPDDATGRNLNILRVACSQSAAAASQKPLNEVGRGSEPPEFHLGRPWGSQSCMIIHQHQSDSHNTHFCFSSSALISSVEENRQRIRCCSGVNFNLSGSFQ